MLDTVGDPQMVVRVCVGSGLPYPTHLSTPVTLTLTLSRRAGEGKPLIASLFCLEVSLWSP